MNEKDQKDFDEWWRTNCKKLIPLYTEEPDFNILVMDLAEAGWEGAVECRNKKSR